MPSGSEAVVMARYVVLTVIVSNLVDVTLLLSVTWTVNVLIPSVAGIPLITPVPALRLSPAGRVPVVMLSGKDALFDKVKGHMAGATEYLTKPFETPAVLTRAPQFAEHTDDILRELGFDEDKIIDLKIEGAVT